MSRLACLVIFLFVVFVSPVLAQDARPGPPDWLTNPTIAAGATLGFLEIVASEACIQRGSCYEANRVLPDGTQKAATVGRALLKGAGTTAAAYLLLRAKRSGRPRDRWLAFVGAVGLVAGNGYLARRALDRFPEARR